MFNKKVFKNISVVMLSLAMITPLAINSTNVNAKSYHARPAYIKKASHKSDLQYLIDLEDNQMSLKHAHGKKATKINNNIKKDEHAIRNITAHHHNYKFAYNKHEYNLAKKDLKKTEKQNLKKTANLRKDKSAIFQKAIIDGINNDFNNHLASNKQYKAGYLAFLTNKNLSGMSKKEARKFYNSSVADKATGSTDTKAHYMNLAGEDLL